jgi:hypothetical protein
MSMFERASAYVLIHTRLASKNMMRKLVLVSKGQRHSVGSYLSEKFALLQC